MVARLRERLDRLERSDGWNLLFLRHCPHCGALVVWGDYLAKESEPDLCRRHQLAPPTGPGDITLEWTGLEPRYPLSR